MKRDIRYYGRPIPGQLGPAYRWECSCGARSAETRTDLWKLRPEALQHDCKVPDGQAEAGPIADR